MEHYLKININMRCIEISIISTSKIVNTEININMRCIEILFGGYGVLAGRGLTLT